MKDRRALVAIDLGAESCRVSVLHWRDNHAEIRIVHRFGNGPVDSAAGLHWDLERICRELEVGLRKCAELVPAGIDSIGVTGWGVDIVRLDDAGKPLMQPYCYREPRNALAMEALHKVIPGDELYARNGVQIQPINTIYQLYADKLAGVPSSAKWLNVPEYILHWLGGPQVGEYTNSTHTGLLDPATRQWADDLFTTLGLDRGAAPALVSPGTLLGTARGGVLAGISQFAPTKLIAPACHDTASAIAGIAAGPGDWAYISSGTWSLVGMLTPESHRTPKAYELGFTNLGAVGGNVLFHRGMAGMWLLRQCMNTWENDRGWEVTELIAEARKAPAPDALLDLDDPSFVTPGDMPARINAQRERHRLKPLPAGCAEAPRYANLIFHSLASRYATLLKEIEELTGTRAKRIRVVGGGNRNEYLNELTVEATGVPVERCSVESSTLGNFAVQWARLEQDHDDVSAARIAERAQDLSAFPLRS
jgi:rhamnulokinase